MRRKTKRSSGKVGLKQALESLLNSLHPPKVIPKQVRTFTIYPAHDFCSPIIRSMTPKDRADARLIPIQYAKPSKIDFNRVKQLKNAKRNPRAKRNKKRH